MQNKKIKNSAQKLLSLIEKEDKNKKDPEFPGLTTTEKELKDKLSKELIDYFLNS
jgi:hypothetical protein